VTYETITFTNYSWRNSIIAVHGLDPLNNEEHGLSTWSQDGVTWLKDFLPHHHRVKPLRVLVFGYNSSAVFGASTAGVYGAAESLINQLSLVRKDCPMRPIVFVCHSLGGIVVKRAIVSAHTTDYYRNIYDSTKGVAFFATPHNGGNGATFGDVLVRICRAVTGNARNDIMEALRRDSNIASHINRDFARRARGLRVLNFIETKPMAKPFLGIVVDRNSASLNWSEPAEIQVFMEATHRTICKYAQEDDLYEIVSENMVDLISWAAELQPQVIIATAPLPTSPSPDPDQFLPPPRYEERNLSHDSLARQSTASTSSYPNNNEEIRDKGSYLFPPSPFLGTTMSAPQSYFEGESSLPSRPLPVWPIHMLPYIPQLKTKLVPRDELFQSMLTSLEDGGTVALYGLGGAGKSNLAARLAYWQIERNPQISVFWIHGGTVDSVSESFRMIAQKLQIGLLVRDGGERFKMMRDWLEEKKHGRWIMIIDGADDPAIFKQCENSDHDRQRQSSLESRTFMDFIPRCSHGQVLFTTKTHSAAAMYATRGAALQVSPLSSSDALQMLQNGLDNSVLLDDTLMATELVTSLHFLPLAIAQATSFMNRNFVNVTKYVEKIRDNTVLADLMTRPQASSSNAVYTTWTISFKMIRSERELAADLLAIISFLEQDRIPLSILGDIFGDTLDLIEAVGDLKDYSLISVCSKVETLNVHRLVQATTQHWLRESGTIEKWAVKALSALANHFPDASTRSLQSKCALYLPHCLKVLQSPHFNQTNDLTLAILQYKIGRYYHIIGQWSEARRWTSAAYTVRKENLGLSDASTLEAQEQMIHILRCLGDFDAAGKEAQSLKHLLKPLHGPKHPSTLCSYRLISSTFQDQSLFAPSLAAALKSFNGFKSLYSVSDPDNQDLLLSIARLGSIYTRIGEFGKAEELNLNLLKTFKRRNEENSVDALKVLYRLSYVQRAVGKYIESEETAKDCYQRYCIHLGSKHAETLKSYFSIGLSLQVQRKFEPAMEVYKKAVGYCREMVGESHVFTFISTFHLAQSLAEVGRLREAKGKFGEAMSGFEQMNPKQELEVAKCKEGIASVLRYSGSLSEAEGMYDQALKMGKSQKGKEGEILIALCWEGLGEIWRLRASEMEGKGKKSNLKKALKFEQLALECRKKVYRSNHPETRRTAELVMGILELLGDSGKLTSRLRSEYGSGGHQGLDTFDRETEIDDLISFE
jgi:tetratricopeptide (TPR) repeat protein